MRNQNPPTWITQKLTGSFTQIVREAMIRFLYQAETSEVLSILRSLLRTIELWRCEMTTLFSLYKILRGKVLAPLDHQRKQKNDQLILYVYNFYFPMISKFISRIG